MTYQLDSASDPVAGTQLDCYGIVSSNTIGSITVVDGTDTGNSVNDVVEMLPTAAWGQDLADALTNQHSRTGAHTVITATSIATTGNSTIGGNETIAGTLAVTGATTLTGTTTITALSNPYKFSVSRAAAANTGNAAFAKVVWDTEAFDTNGNFATGTYTAPVAGFYYFDAAINVIGGTTHIIALYKNGSEFRRGNQIATAGGLVVSVLIQLSAADTIDIYAFGATADALDVTAGLNYFTGFLLSTT